MLTKAMIASSTPNYSKSSGEVVLQTIFTLCEPGTYLIALCLPSVPKIFSKVTTILGNGYNSLLQIFRDPSSGTSASMSLRTRSVKKVPGDPKIDMRLTGLGNPQTLLHETTQSV